MWPVRDKKRGAVVFSSAYAPRAFVDGEWVGAIPESRRIAARDSIRKAIRELDESN